MAPEIHAGKPYDYAVEFWSLGILFYECVYGIRPFRGKTTEEISTRVCENLVVYDETSPAVSQDCRSVLEGLLTKSPQNRMRSVSACSRHPFFDGIDFKLVALGVSPPVYRPGATKNFDASWELEEILLHDSPLDAQRTPTKRRPSRTTSSTNQQLDLLETYFTDFDFRKIAVASDDESTKLTLRDGQIFRDSLEISREADVRLDTLDDIEQLSAPKTVSAKSISAKPLTSPNNSWRLGPRRKTQGAILSPGVLVAKAGGRLRGPVADQSLR